MIKKAERMKMGTETVWNSAGEGGGGGGGEEGTACVGQWLSDGLLSENLINEA